MPPLDRRRLAKIMARTQSDQSGEVFSALVIANRLLRDADETWETVLVGRGSTPVIRSGGANAPAWMRGAPTKTIEEAIDYLLERDQPVKLGAWLESLRRRINGKIAGRVLTPKEQGTLFEIVDEEERRRAGRS